MNELRLNLNNSLSAYSFAYQLFALATTSLRELTSAFSPPFFPLSPQTNSASMDEDRSQICHEFQQLISRYNDSDNNTGDIDCCSFQKWYVIEI